MDTTPPLTPERPPKKVPGNNRLGCKMLQQPSSVRPSPGLQIPINSYPASNVVSIRSYYSIKKCGRWL